MCSSSHSRVWALDARVTKLESSANLNISFPAVIGRRSDAVTMYANGPRPEPCMTLAQSCPRVGWTRGSGRVGSVRVTILSNCGGSGRVGSALRNFYFY